MSTQDNNNAPKAETSPPADDNQPFTALLRTAPVPNDPARAEELHQELKTLIEANPDLAPLANALSNSPALEALLSGIFGNSPFLSSLITRHPAYLLAILKTPPASFMATIGECLATAMAAATSLQEAMHHLRLYKQQAALFIAMADLGGVWPLEKVVNAITVTADTSLREAVRFLFRLGTERGEIQPPDPADPVKDSGYIVLAMGKQGAHELNYSSDVDLIVFFDQAKARLREDLTPAPYFVKLTRHLAKLMQEYTEDGYVFRVDFRLRPDPGATQVALSTDAAFSYYESFGQNWERAALIKARPCAGDIPAGRSFLKGLAPFIWRKYLDFAAIDDIHAMKRQVHAHKGHGKIAIAGHNIKLGRGGIREIEFFAQTQQLIAGGRQPELRTLKTLETLNGLVENNWIKPEARDDLTAAYIFLRTIEHRIQMIADEQTHSLPHDSAGMARIAHFSGFETVEQFSETLHYHLLKVQQHYAELFEDIPALSSKTGNLVFVGDTPDPGTVETLSQMGFNDPDRIIETVRGWHFGRYAATRSARSRERLTEFQPLLLEAIAKTAQPDLALATFDRFLKDLPAGVQLFSLLSSNPNLLRLIAEIMGTAPSLARTLSRRTRLLDAVLDPGFFGLLPNEEELKTLIEEEFATCRDYQDTLDRARATGQEQAFLTGVRLLSGVINSTEAARGYTQLAETIIQELQAKVTEEIECQHGSFKGAGASVLAMGKLGGREMTASSDIDIILIYDFEEGQVMSDGKKPLSPSQYYARYTQRLIAALSAPTAEGLLYEVDMRLRPSGRSGPVATRLESFTTYQHDQAWVWEHLALTRARPITGPETLQQKLRDAIHDVLVKPRNHPEILKYVEEMRQKIEQEKGTDNIWDIKQHRGGLIDLEFIAQTLQLLHGSDTPEILDTNTICVLEKLQKASLLPADITSELYQAAIFYNDLMQIIRLCTDKEINPETITSDLKIRLAESVAMEDFEAVNNRLAATMARIKEIYDQIFSNP